MIRIPRNHTVYSFSRRHPARYRARPGDSVVFETLDALGGQIVDEATPIESIDWSRVNPATGPLYVEGAEAGDTLVVEIESIEVSDRGVIVVAPGFGALHDRSFRPRAKVVWVKNGRLLFNDIEIGVKPMIGVIGVAPEDGDIPTGTSGYHGGNMDVNLITAGSKVYLPVFVEGALVAIGDLHAVQADGELCVAAVEVSGEIQVKIGLIKGRRPHYPIVETLDRYAIITFGRDLDEAVYRASEEAVSILSRAFNAPFEEAYMLSSLLVDVRINQVVDPVKGVRAEIPKKYVRLDHLLYP
ncbi:MAG: acetamidase/formamidase family protein [Ignisphaera sp.]|nr:acetamidase/formamidase family protein [Ignisphaera sp.]MDW8084812.1 acetamidase/formamidase family protein [Ignisphaera sp.]